MNQEAFANLKQQYIWHDCDPGFDDSVAIAMLTAG
jgi:inosine-uridine nucleoside N-ribohydrolase